MSRKFTRNIEDFTCGHCGAAVTGDGYTNHCPKCLYSKHVDINPGDRAHECGGLMKPISIETDRSGYVIIHECVICGAVKRNKSHDHDDPAARHAVARARAESKI